MSRLAIMARNHHRPSFKKVAVPQYLQPIGQIRMFQGSSEEVASTKQDPQAT
jgi:hypothetical protein